MSVFELNKPWIYNGRWNVFPDTVWSDMNVSDCNDTISGICRHTNSIEECIKICEEDPNRTCGAGYFIRTPDNKNFCVPLRPYASEKTTPYYRFRNKSFYPATKDLEVTSFVNTSFPYPPDMANVIFYTDHFVLKNVETGIHIGITNQNTLSESIVFTRNEPVHVQLLPNQITRSLENYITVRNGHEIIINVPHTAFILRKKDNEDEITWVMRATVANAPSNTFQIYSQDKNKPYGEILNYNDKFYFTYQNQPVIYDESLNILSVANTSIENAIQNKNNIFFEFVPKVEVYYCEEQKCNAISLDKTERTGNIARYKGIPVGRSSACWSMCNSRKKRNIAWLLVIISLILFVAITIFILWRSGK